MKEIVYLAANMVEANAIIKSLEAHKIIAEAELKEDDEKLGMQRPIGLVPIIVEERDVEETLIFVKEWKEKRQLESTPDNSPKTFRYILISLVLGVILGACYYENKYILSPEGTEANLNSKGLFYENDRLVKWELDNNKDSKIDEIRYYNDQEKVYKIEGDYNYNGIFETFSNFENEILKQSSVDTNEDTKINCTHFYEKGAWVKTEYFDFKTKKVFKEDTINGLFMYESKLDVDRDGKFDLLSKFNQYGIKISEEKINQSN